MIRRLDLTLIATWERCKTDPWYVVSLVFYSVFAFAFGAGGVLLYDNGHEVEGAIVFGAGMFVVGVT